MTRKQTASHPKHGDFITRGGDWVRARMACCAIAALLAHARQSLPNMAAA